MNIEKQAAKLILKEAIANLQKVGELNCYSTRDVDREDGLAILDRMNKHVNELCKAMVHCKKVMDYHEAVMNKRDIGYREEVISNP